MTRSDLKTQVRLALSEPAAIYWTDTDLNESVQDSYNLSAVLSATIEKSATINLQANLTYYDLETLIPDHYATFSVFNPETREFLTPTSSLQLMQMRPDWELATGTPRKFFPLNFRYLAIFPRPVTTQGTLTINYRAKAPELTSDATSLLTPTELDQGYIEYVVGDLLAQQTELKKFQRRYLQFLKGLKSAKSRANNRQLPDRIYQLRPQGMT